MNLIICPCTLTICPDYCEYRIFFVPLRAFFENDIDNDTKNVRISVGGILLPVFMYPTTPSARECSAEGQHRQSGDGLAAAGELHTSHGSD